MAPFEFYARALSKGLRRKLVARLGAEAADAIDEFLSLALAYESAHPPSLEGFLDWFEKGASEVKRDMEQGAGAVRVMTVHGAKGLEANIVILPDTAQIAEQERRAGLLYTEDCVFFGVNNDAQHAGRCGGEDRSREARDARVSPPALCGDDARARMADPDRLRDAQRHAPGLLVRADPRGADAVMARGRDRRRDCACDRRAVARRGRPLAEAESRRTALPEFLSRAAPAEPEARIVRPSDAVEAHQPAPVSPIEDDGARFRRGLLIHALLAHLPEVAERGAREPRAVLSEARGHRAQDDAKAIVAEIFGVLAIADFAPLFTPASRAEVGVTALLPELGNGASAARSTGWR